MKTAIISCLIPNAVELTVGTDYAMSIPWTSLPCSLQTVIKLPSTGLAGLQGKDNAVWLDAVRLYSNFADGLVPVAAVPPQLVIHFWHGGNRLINPDKSIAFSTEILNEWFPVEMPLPRDPETVLGYGGVTAGFVGNLKFRTDSISTDFNGAIPRFEIQCRVKSAYL